MPTWGRGLSMYSSVALVLPSVPLCLFCQVEGVQDDALSSPNKDGSIGGRHRMCSQLPYGRISIDMKTESARTDHIKTPV